MYNVSLEVIFGRVIFRKIRKIELNRLHLGHSRYIVGAIIETSYRLDLPEKDWRVLDKLDEVEKDLSKLEKRTLFNVVKSIDKLEARKMGIKNRSSLKLLRDAAKDRTKEISLNTPNRKKVLQFYNLTRRNEEPL